MTMKQCFSHFDLKSNQFVDVDDLRIGLSQLGIDISFEAGEELLEMIGQVSGVQFRQCDLEHFVMQSDEDEDKDVVKFLNLVSQSI